MKIDITDILKVDFYKKSLIELGLIGIVWGVSATILLGTLATKVSLGVQECNPAAFASVKTQKAVLTSEVATLTADVDSLELELSKEKSPLTAENTESSTSFAAMEDTEVMLSEIDNTTTSVNINYFIGQLSESIGVDVSEINISDDNIITLKMSGYYTDIMLFFRYMNHFSSAIPVSSFDMTGLVYDVTNNKPLGDFVASDAIYDWSQGESLGVSRSNSLFYDPTAPVEPVEGDDTVADSSGVQSAVVAPSKISIDSTTDTYGSAEDVAESYSMTPEELKAFIAGVSAANGLRPGILIASAEKLSEFNNSFSVTPQDGSVARGVFAIKSSEAATLASELDIEYVEGMEFNPKYSTLLGVQKYRDALLINGKVLTDLTDADFASAIATFNPDQTFIDSVVDSSFGYTSFDGTEDSITANDCKSEFNLMRKELETYYGDSIASIEESVAAGAVTASVDSDESEIESTPAVVIERVNMKVELKIVSPKLFKSNWTYLKFDGSSIGSPFMFDTQLEVSDLDIGNNGMGELGSTESMLKLNNREYRLTEIDRTKKVIRSRIIMGLSVINQYQYMDKLVEMEFENAGK